MIADEAGLVHSRVLYAIECLVSKVTNDTDFVSAAQCTGWSQRRMAVRFSKLKTINLDDEDEEELKPMVGEGEEAGGGEWSADHNDGDSGRLDDGGQTQLIIEDEETAQVKKKGLTRWLHRSRRSYSPLKPGRRRKCPCNSWKVVAIAVFIFTAAFLISLIISSLVPEPTEGKEDGGMVGRVRKTVGC